MDTPKVVASQRSRNPDCPSCGQPMYPHRGRFLCTCGRVYAPDRVNLAKHLQAAEDLGEVELTVPVCAA